jgi:hypothetical protein
MSRQVPRHLLASRAWRSRTGRLLHRQLDNAGWQARDRDRDPGRAPRPGELERIMTYDRERRPRVLLLELEEATSGRGTVYWRGWAGKARLVGFRNSEPNERGFPTIRIYAEEPEPRPQIAPASAAAAAPARVR